MEVSKAVLIYANWQSGLGEILMYTVHILYLLFIMVMNFIGFIKFQNTNKTRILKKFGSHQIVLWQHWFCNKIGLYINV